MSEVAWDRVRDVFESALDAPPQERQASVERMCAGDAELQSEVERLLALHQDDDFLDTQHASPTWDALGDATAGPAVGESFAGFRLLGVLGAGGMGCVYEAEQQEPRRKVALKVLRSGLVSDKAVARFRWEAELLARLRHPGIAQVYATGMEPDALGREVPWFALELVSGAQPITAAVVDRALDRRAALRLFAEACDAVQHGHHHGVIHRDIKPANVLVDDEGRVKVIDFGVAGVVERDEASTRLTQAGDLVGTLGSMSPEQLLGDPDAVDARSDVYALGAILHQLLCGEPLYDLRGCSVAAIARKIQVETPRKPSDVRAGVPEELDWVVARAVEHDVSARYGSASELAAEVRRVLAREPVLAGPPSASYRMRSFVRRHRVGVLVTSAVVLSLLLGLISTTSWMLTAKRNAQHAEEETVRAEAEATRADAERLRAEEQAALADAERQRAEEQAQLAELERERAQEQAALSEAVTDFVIGLIRSPDPALDGNEVRVVDVLSRVDEQLELSLAEQPALAATLHATLGRLHYNLGLLEDAEQHLSTSLALSTDSDHEELLARRAARGEVLRERGDLSAAEADLSAVHANRLELLGADHADTAISLSSLALLRQTQGRAEEAEQMYAEALEVLRAELGVDDELVLRTEANLAGLWLAARRHEEARESLADLLPRMQAQLGARHPATVLAQANLASLYVFVGRLEEAAELMQEVMSVHRALLPPGHNTLLLDMSNLSVLRLQLGQVEEAIALCSEVIQARQQEDPLAADVILMRCNLLHMLNAAGDRSAVQTEIDALLAMQLDGVLDQTVPLAYLENTSRDVATWGLSKSAMALAQTGLRGRLRLTPSDEEGLFAAWRACALVASIAGEDPSPVFAELLRWRSRLSVDRGRELRDAFAEALRKVDRAQHAELWLEACAAVD